MKRTPDNKSLEQSAVWAVTRLETSVVRLPESYGSARLLNSMLGAFEFGGTQIVVGRM